MVSSLLPETINLLSGLIVTELKLQLLSINLLIYYPLSKFHTLIVLSELPEIINLLS